MRTERTPSPTPSSPSAYQTLRPLARGGMGSVDIAMLRKPGFRRLFAIKRLRPELLEDERAKAMLLEEGRIAGLLQHPNIVPVVDVGEDPQGPYLVMDLVPGVALGDLVRWARTAKTKLDVQLVLRLVRDAARGLHAAHELRDANGRPLSLVHRDISPQNILVGFDGIARVTDFGIAKVLDRDRETTHGLLKGKTGYMSPEQLRFETIDRRADLFSLGVVLYECLAAERLYRGKDLPETARMILHAPPPDIGAVRADVPPEIVELLFELLAKDREARPSTAKEVENRLEAAIHVLAQDGAFDVEAFLKSELTDKFEETTQWGKLLEAPAVASEDVAIEVDGPPTEVSAVRETATTRAAPPRARAIAVAVGVAVIGTIALGLGLAWDGGGSAAPQATSAPPDAPQGTSASPDAEREVAPQPIAPQGAASPPSSAGAAAPEQREGSQGQDPQGEQEITTPEEEAPRAAGSRARRRGRRVSQADGVDAGPRRRIVDQDFWTEEP